MGSISRANVHDVLKNKPHSRPIIALSSDGKKKEAREVKRPEGRVVEQMVDPQGNVVWIKLLALGTNHGPDEAVRRRHEHRQLGFLEYHKCPLRHGTHNDTRFAQELAVLPSELEKECPEDPVIHTRRAGVNYEHEACPHIQWLIESRRAAEEKRRELRATTIETPQDIEKKKLAVAEQMLAATHEQNAKIVELLEHQTKGNAKRGKQDKADE